ncbi:hypothetical protein [Bradyrhizobium sp.]|uniref:hypothetical protein n=1 Tax=Bradyrhizobium sp. TaxID=376 RepID=UPI0025C5EDEE|nr:hypothetical protein [Bradyrhizobium sp.]MBV8920700.1 hypothetical protein [Bradyrhizobium sp.]
MPGQIDRHVIDPAVDIAKRDFRFELQHRRISAFTAIAGRVEPTLISRIHGSVRILGRLVTIARRTVRICADDGVRWACGISARLGRRQWRDGDANCNADSSNNVHVCLLSRFPSKASVI